MGVGESWWGYEEKKVGGGGVGESLWGYGEKMSFGILCTHSHTCSGSSLRAALRVGTRAARRSTRGTGAEERLAVCMAE